VTRAGGLAGLALLVGLAACAERGGRGASDAVATDVEGVATSSPQEAFWENLLHHCGRAYPGRLVLEPPGDAMLTGTEALIVHFRECSDDRIAVPFHVEVEETGEWDRSRTWNFLRRADGLELRHDHRHADGGEDDSTWYGGMTRDGGEPQRQEFILAERTAPDGSALGWRVEIVPDERYTYGTIRGGEWTWRVDFDLSEPVAAPPAPWGADTPPAGLRR
jgi:hypothetical protein